MNELICVFREEFDKINMSESSNLLDQLVIASDFRKVKQYSSFCFLYSIDL